MNPLHFFLDPFGYGNRKISRLDAPYPLRSDLAELKVLVTGASKGIGLALCESLKDSEISVIAVARSCPEALRGFDCVQLDLSKPQDILRFVEDSEELDGLVFNAGAMPLSPPPIDPLTNLDSLYILHILGPAFITRELVKRRRFKPGARIIIVTSGGGLTTPLSRRYMGQLVDPYDGVKQYAIHKRQQMVLCEYLHQQYHEDNLHIYCMHPGWVDTPGLREAMPGFHRLTKSILRNPYQGADTINWLLTGEEQGSGRLYFDGSQVSTNPLPWVRDKSQKKREFGTKLEEQLALLKGLLT